MVLHISKKLSIFLNSWLSTYDSAMGAFINDVPCFLAIFDLPTYLVLLQNVPFLRLSWTPLPTVIRDIVNEHSLLIKNACTYPNLRSQCCNAYLACFDLWRTCKKLKKKTFNVLVISKGKLKLTLTVTQTGTYIFVNRDR
jgi:hypothetical protein